MTCCARFLTASAPYVDGALPGAERAAFEAHLAGCAACREAVRCETEAHQALAACRPGLLSRILEGSTAFEPLPAQGRARAPKQLRDAVVELSHGRSAWARTVLQTVPRPNQPRPARWTSWPVGAALALAVAGVVGYGLLTRNGTALAAQLALDHMKCVRILSPQTPASSVRELSEAWQRRHGWRVALPEAGAGAGAGYELVTLRRCLHAHGFVAHALYRRGDHLVSLFVFARDVQANGVLEIMGERASIWSSGSHTYAVVGADSPAELDRFVELARHATE